MSGQQGYYPGAVYGVGYQDQQPHQSYDPRQYPQQPPQGYGSPQYSQPQNQQYYRQPSGNDDRQSDLVNWQGSVSGGWSSEEPKHPSRRADTDPSRTNEFVEEARRGLGGSGKKHSTKSRKTKDDHRRKANKNIDQFDNTFNTAGTQPAQQDQQNWHYNR
ncbi:hypothetical protein BKA56DRAFT_616845 [Ilyonectria sp. MPI-CAGE-AT-0026]|nr:hypothetical protein BKA56DRAFT_616845 [Ilyonectria sp. MPI-CAGE-AT-0026]